MQFKGRELGIFAVQGWVIRLQAPVLAELSIRFPCIRSRKSTFFLGGGGEPSQKFLAFPIACSWNELRLSRFWFSASRLLASLFSLRET